MIQITPQMRVLVAIEPTDFRRGIDGLARQCREALQSDPFSGTVFVFCNRRKTAVKVLVYDGQGFWLCHKRLSSGRFRFWPPLPPRTDTDSSGGAVTSLQAHELQVLLRGGDPKTTNASPDWRPVAK